MASKNTKKFKKYSSESVAPFSRCSQLKSLLSLLRRTHKASSSNLLTPLKYTKLSLTPSHEYKNRLKQLEQELDRLKARVVNGPKRSEESGNVSDDLAVKKCLFGEDKEEEEELQEIQLQDFVRLKDGSLLHEITKVWIRAGRKMEGLCMQVSSPTVADDAVSASEVLSRMTMFKMGDLCKYLMNLMPMTDITGQNPTTLTTPLSSQPNSQEYFVDSILFNSLQKLETLILEGLTIQTSTNLAPNYNSTPVLKNPNECVVIVALIQVRDSRENLRSVGELMIGIIEAELMVENGDFQKFRVSEVTVAGLNHARKKIKGSDFMWSVSLKCCGGSDGSGFVARNPDRLFGASGV